LARSRVEFGRFCLRRVNGREELRLGREVCGGAGFPGGRYGDGAVLVRGIEGAEEVRRRQRPAKREAATRGVERLPQREEDDNLGGGGSCGPWAGVREEGKWAEAEKRRKSAHE
jgi:hypothetical protein